MDCAWFCFDFRRLSDMVAMVCVCIDGSDCNNGSLSTYHYSRSTISLPEDDVAGRQVGVDSDTRAVPPLPALAPGNRPHASDV